MVATEAAPQRRVYLTPRQQRDLGVAAPTLQLLMERVALPTGTGTFIWAALAAETGTKLRTLQNHTRTLVTAGCLTTEDHGRSGVRYTVSPTWWARVELLPLAGSAPDVVREAPDPLFVFDDLTPEEVRQYRGPFRLLGGSAPKVVRFPHPDDYGSGAEALEVVGFAPESAPAVAREAAPTCARVVSLTTPALSTGSVVVVKENIDSSLPNNNTDSATPVTAAGVTRDGGVTRAATPAAALAPASEDMWDDLPLLREAAPRPVATAPAAPAVPVARPIAPSNHPAVAAPAAPRRPQTPATPAPATAPLILEDRARADRFAAALQAQLRTDPAFGLDSRGGTMTTATLVTAATTLVRAGVSDARFSEVLTDALSDPDATRHCAAYVVNVLRRHPGDRPSFPRRGGDRRGIVHGELRPEVLLAQAAAAGVALARTW